MSGVQPLPPHVCPVEWCRREGRCFMAAKGRDRCMDHRTALVMRRQQASETAVLPTIGHRPAADRPGFGFPRPPCEHQVWCSAEEYDALRRKVQTFLILPHDRDFRQSDMLLIRVRGDDSKRLWRVVSHAVERHDALLSGFVALALHGT